MIEQATQHLLKADAGVAAIVTTRVHLAERPQTYDLPALVVQRGGRNRLRTLKGPTGTDHGFVRITCLASSYLQARDLAKACTAAIDGYTGTVTVKDAEGNDQAVVIKRLRHEDEDDIPSDHRDGEGRTRTHGIQIDFDYSLAS